MLPALTGLFLVELLRSRAPLVLHPAPSNLTPHRSYQTIPLITQVASVSFEETPAGTGQFEVPLGYACRIVHLIWTAMSRGAVEQKNPCQAPGLSRRRHEHSWFHEEDVLGCSRADKRTSAIEPVIDTA